VFDPPELVEQVGQRPDRVPPGHPRAGEAHDLAGRLALGGLVAVDRAVGAGRLVYAVRALFKPPFRVIHQFRAVGAQAAVCLAIVMMVTEYVCHAHQGFVFPLQSAVEPIHAHMITV